MKEKRLSFSFYQIFNKTNFVCICVIRTFAALLIGKPCTTEVAAYQQVQVSSRLPLQVPSKGKRL